MQIRPYEPDDEAAVIALWRQCGLTRPWNDPQRDIQRKLAIRPDWFLIGHVGGKLMASAMVGYDGHRGWIYYLGVAPACQRHGYGRLIMAEAERLLRSAGCPKINLQMRTENTQAAAFYRSIGFAPDDVISFGKRLVDDTASQE